MGARPALVLASSQSTVGSLMVRGLLLVSFGAGLVGVVDAIWGGVWKTEGWVVVCLSFLVAAQVAERMRR